MRKPFILILLTLLGVLLSCTDMEKTDCDIALEIDARDYSNYLVDVSSGFPPTMRTFRIISVPKNPGAQLSDADDVEISYLLAKWVRTDSGTVRPKDFRQGWTVMVPAGGNATLNNINFMGLEQLMEPPFTALLPENGGRDPETGASTIVCDAHIQAYGRTMNGCDVVSREAILTFEFYYGGGR